MCVFNSSEYVDRRSCGDVSAVLPHTLRMRRLQGTGAKCVWRAAVGMWTGDVSAVLAHTLASIRAQEASVCGEQQRQQQFQAELKPILPCKALPRSHCWYLIIHPQCLPTHTQPLTCQTACRHCCSALPCNHSW